MERRAEIAAALCLVLLLGGFSLALARHTAAGVPIDGADEAEYLTLARRLAEHGELSVRTQDPHEYVGLNLLRGRDGAYYGKHPYGYPLLLAAARRLGGPPAQFAVSPLFAVLAVAGTFLLGRALAGATGGLVAAALLAANPLHAGYGASPMSHAPAIACTVWAMFHLWRWQERGGRRDAVLAGALCGFAATLRYAEVVLVLPVAVAFLLRWRHARRGAATRSTAREAALLAAAGLLVYGPVLLFHWLAWGSPFVAGQGITEGSGLSLQYFPRNLRVFFEQVWRSGLWVVTATGLAGLAALLARGKRAGPFLASWALGHFLIYSTFYWRGGDDWGADLRYYLDVFPPLILASVAGAALLSRPRAHGLALALLLLAVGIANLGETRDLLRRAHASGAVMERVGPLIRETLPDGTVVFTDEGFVQALASYGDYLVYYDAMFHPSFVASYAPILDVEGPWPVSRARIRTWVEQLGGRSEAELAELERRIVAEHLAADRSVVFVTGGNHAPEWRQRLGARFAIEPLVERSLYLDAEDPRFPSGRLAVFALRPR